MRTEQLADGVICVELSGEFDLAQAYEFDRRLQDVEGAATVALVLDLRGVSFCDSAGLARILAARRRAERDGRRFAVVRGCPAIDRLLALTALDRQFDMIADPRAVLETA